MSFTQETEDQVTENQNPTAEDKGGKDEIVINGRTYRSVEDIEKKITNADEFIETLKTEGGEKDELIAELMKRLGTKEEAPKEEEKPTTDNDILQEILASLKPETASKPEPQKEAATPADPPVSKEELLKQVKEDLKHEAEQEVATKNLDTAISAAKKAYGDEWLSTVKEKAEALGMTMQDVDRVASRSPVAFNQLFMPQAKPATGPVGGTLVDSSGNPPAEKPKNFLRMSSKERAAYVKEQLSQLSQ